jgi:hypothetical protein
MQGRAWVEEYSSATSAVLYRFNDTNPSWRDGWCLLVCAMKIQKRWRVLIECEKSSLGVEGGFLRQKGILEQRYIVIGGE